MEPSKRGMNRKTREFLTIELFSINGGQLSETAVLGLDSESFTIQL